MANCTTLPSRTVFDAAVIGGGVVGCAVLRALTLAGMRCLLLERGSDLLSGASKANSAILHTAFDAPLGSLEHKLMRAGRAKYLELREQLGLPLLETDALLVAWDAAQAARLPEYAARAAQNGVDGVRPLELPELRRRSPFLSTTAVAALLVPGESVIDPWSAPLGYALQALANGAVIERLAEVKSAGRNAGLWRLETNQGIRLAKTVVNCAGIWGDVVEQMHRPSPFRILPRKGQFLIFDKTARRFVPTIVLPVPSERTKGIVVCPTVFGNVLVGPTAEDQEDRSRSAVESPTLAKLRNEALRIVPALESESPIASFAGLRPATEQRDYYIEAIPRERWITVGGIRSTGLTSALGIADYVAALVEEYFQKLTPIPNPMSVRVPNLAEDGLRDHQQPGRGELVCMCELVTRREIDAALSGPLPAGDLGGLKRRTRAMLGRCQGFSCMAAVCDIAEKKMLVPPPLPRVSEHA